MNEFRIKGQEDIYVLLDDLHKRVCGIENRLSLGSSVPPGSESALRSSLSDKPPLTNRADPDSALRGNDHTDQDILRRDVESIFLRLDELDKRIECLILASPAQRIGVYDYDSLVACLRTNFDELFHLEGQTDPQNMVQLMAAEIQNLRRSLNA